ncbi:hypothetical protein, partial [Roseicella aquatilis]|uniref:hypothetical protein n=1 Tax=Roseicella aquatilis TaxID=2527868 RepID=UPI0019802E9B
IATAATIAASHIRKTAANHPSRRNGITNESAIPAARMIRDPGDQAGTPTPVARVRPTPR